MGKLSEKQSKTSSYVSHKTLTTHFQVLLNTVETVTPHPHCSEEGPLDEEITLEELYESAKCSLPAGKGVGADNICNEMIVCLIEVCPEIILKLLLTENKTELEALLKMVSDYCRNNKLTINCKKNKCMIFNQTGRLSKEKVFMNGVHLENVREYKYLGFIFTPSGEIGTGLQDLRDRDFKAFQALKLKWGCMIE